MEVEILYEIVGSYHHTVNLDEYADDILDEYGKPWEELSDDEKNEFMLELGHQLYHTAEAESDYSLGAVEAWVAEDNTENWFI
jgi:hypothetical protein